MTKEEKDLIKLAYGLVNDFGGTIEVAGKYVIHYNLETRRTEIKTEIKIA